MKTMKEKEFAINIVLRLGDFGYLPKNQVDLHIDLIEGDKHRGPNLAPFNIIMPWGIVQINLKHPADVRRKPPVACLVKMLVDGAFNSGVAVGRKEIVRQVRAIFDYEEAQQ